MKEQTARILIPLCASLCLLPFVSGAAALLGGIIIALTLGNPYVALTRKLSPKGMAIGIIGLGAGMNLAVIGQVGAQGLVYTICGIALAFAAGTILGRIFNVGRDTSVLICAGTAICGGSAIAALAPVIRAKDHEISIALSIVFILNALALVIFPPIGHALELTQHQFGLWSALAIHDTSSVVGATLQYGAEAVETGTTVKLSRALWIIPVAFAVGIIRARQDRKADTAPEAAGKAKRPWFILWFLVAAALVTFFPMLQPAGEVVSVAAKRVLIATLFLIGAGLTRDALRHVGFAPFMQGVALWVIVAGGTLGAILLGWIA